MSINKGRTAANILGIMLVAAMVAQPAHAQGLSNAKSVLDGFLSELKTIVPVAATIALIGLALAYAAKMVEKDTLIRWGIGIIVAGSAGTLATTLFAGS